jgi:hypothetical protein
MLNHFWEMSYRSHELLWCLPLCFTHMCIFLCSIWWTIFIGFADLWCWDVESRTPLVDSVSDSSKAKASCLLPSVGHVWCQIRVLLEDKQFQLALKLTVCIIIMIRLYLRCQIHYGSWGLYIYGIGWLGSADVKFITERKVIGSDEFLVSSWEYFLWTFSVI